jgi:hypothetical protein
MKGIWIMSDTMKKNKKTRIRSINISDETLARYREEGSENPSPMAVMLQSLPDVDAKKLIQRTENAVEKVSKSALDKDQAYQEALKTFNAAKNTFYRTRNSLNLVDVTIPNPAFDSDAPVGDSNPETVVVKRDKFQVRIATLQSQIEEIERKRSVAASEVADGKGDLPEGVLHKNMREARNRKRALARRAIGLNGSQEPTPDDVLTDGE